MQNFILKALLLALVSLNYGCAQMTEFQSTEAAWQVAHLVDIGQTVAIANNPDCYYERMTDTQALIGTHPSESDVYKWGIGVAVFHFFKMKLIDKFANDKVSVAVRTFDLGYKTHTVVSNHRMGLRADGTSTAKALYRQDTGQKVNGNRGHGLAACSYAKPDVSTGLTWKF